MRGNFSLTQFPTSETGTLWMRTSRQGRIQNNTYHRDRHKQRHIDEAPYTIHRLALEQKLTVRPSTWPRPAFPYADWLCP